MPGVKKSYPLAAGEWKLRLWESQALAAGKWKAREVTRSPQASGSIAVVAQRCEVAPGSGQRLVFASVIAMTPIRITAMPTMSRRVMLSPPSNTPTSTATGGLT